MAIVLKDNLIKASHHNVVMGMGIKKPKQSMAGNNNVVPLAVSMGKVNLTGGSLVGTTSQPKRKPIEFM